MARPHTMPPPDSGQSMARAFAANEQMNQLVLAHLDPRAWRAQPPGERKGRNIAAIFSHVHNIRRKWIRLSAPHLKLPPQLDRARCTQDDAAEALAGSAERCSEMLEEALRPDGRVKSFLRDGWARPFPAGAGMLAYMVAHDAHHRGQVCMLARQLGFPLRGEGAYGIWNWEKLLNSASPSTLSPSTPRRSPRTGHR